MLWSEVLILIGSIITSALSGIGGSYLFAKRKYRADVASIELDNNKTMITFWQENFKIIADQNRDITSYASQVVAQNMELQNTISVMQTKIINLEQQLNHLKSTKNV